MGIIKHLSSVDILANGALLLGQRGYISRCGPDATNLGFMVSGCLHGGREWVRLSPAFVSFKMINTVWSPWDFGWKIPFPWALCITLVEFRQIFSCAKKPVELKAAFTVNWDIMLSRDHPQGGAGVERCRKSNNFSVTCFSFPQYGRKYGFEDCPVHLHRPVDFIFSIQGRSKGRGKGLVNQCRWGECLVMVSDRGCQPDRNR